jgi:hypothetical protein
MTVRAWLKEGAYMTWRWLFGVVRGAQWGSLMVVECVRAVFSSTAVLALMGALDYALANLNLLPPRVSERITIWVGLATFCIHILVQLFQADPSAAAKKDEEAAKGEPYPPPSPYEKS